MKAVVKFMNGGRTNGYYFVRLKGTDLIACDSGHPDFPFRFKEGTDEPKKKARAVARKINRQLTKIRKAKETKKKIAD